MSLLRQLLFVQGMVGRLPICLFTLIISQSLPQVCMWLDQESASGPLANGSVPQTWQVSSVGFLLEQVTRRRGEEERRHQGCGEVTTGRVPEGVHGLCVISAQDTGDTGGGELQEGRNSQGKFRR